VKTSGEIARRWWTSLQPARERGYRGDPGALARLRRASLIDAMTEPVTVRLHRELGLTRQTFSRAALVACVLAHVREDEPRLKVARAAGPQSSGETGVLSALRFRRLLNMRGEEDCSIAFRRLAALLGKMTRRRATGAVRVGLSTITTRALPLRMASPKLPKTRKLRPRPDLTTPSTEPFQ
jgi:hypothetical protein